jgi:hypothetical protein
MKSGIIQLLLLSSISIGFFACGTRNSLETETKNLDSLLQHDTLKEQIQEFVHIFPSQVKVARLFKNAGLKYQSTELAPPACAEKLTTKQEKALALGILGVDMVYSAMNNQTQLAMTNMKISRNLATDLGLESVYAEQDYVRKFEQNLGNQDTLEALIKDLFAETDAFLKDNKKLDLNLLSFAGGWTESVYLASTYAYATKNKGIVQLIGDQLISLDPLIQLFKENKKEANNDDLVKELDGVRNAIRAGIVTEETDTEPMVIEMDDKKLENLISSLQIIRNRIIKPKP